MRRMGSRSARSSCSNFSCMRTTSWSGYGKASRFRTRRSATRKRAQRRSDAYGEDTDAPVGWGEGDGTMPDPCGACGQPIENHPFQGHVEGSDANIYHVLCKPPLLVIRGACEACDWQPDAKLIPQRCPKCGGWTSPSY